MTLYPTPCPHCSLKFSREKTKEEIRVEAARPLLMSAISFLHEAVQARGFKEDDPNSRYHQAILEAYVSLGYAIDSINGALALYAPLAGYSDKLEEIRNALRPVHAMGAYFHTMPESDPIIEGSFWAIFDRLVTPQIARLKGEAGL